MWTGKEIVVLGQHSGVSPEGSREGHTFNLAANSWRVIPRPEPPCIPAGRGAWLDGVLAVQGAVSPRDGGAAVDRLLPYDPNADTWTSAAPPPGSAGGFATLYATWRGVEELLPGENAAMAYDRRRDRRRVIDFPEGRTTHLA